MIRLPPLPPCDYVRHGYEWYTEDQMHAYAAAARLAALEEAVKLCEDLERSIWDEYKNGHRSSSHTEGRSDGAAECADAIRLLKNEKN